MEIKAYAKINLGLDVLGRRPDGYHDVRLVMQTLDLYDTLMLEELPEQEGEIRFQILAESDGACEGAQGVMGARVDPSSLPIDDSNLCIKAARALLADAGCRKGVHITLIKRVPFEAGLGGGSADAAAVLNGLNELLGLSYTKEKLAEIGLSVGADVPYLVYGGCALAEGIGERITPIEAAVEDVSVLLVKPDFGAATGGIYSAFDALSDPLHPDIDGLIRALCAGDLPQAAGKMGNALEGVTAASHPEMEEIKEEIKKAGALAAAMTGSGPTIFGLFSDADLCRQAAALLFEAHRDWFVCECGFTNSRRPASD